MKEGAPPPPPRFARLVLVNREGEVLGALAPFPVETPWWEDVEPVVRGARERHGASVTVLRMLEAERASTPGGTVTYLAEAVGPVATEPWAGSLSDHPLRQSYARPGGPAEDLAWADSALASLGLRREAPAEQVRTWNLSSLWRLPIEGQTAWLKVVPPFFGHEGAILARLAGQPVPRLLAHDGRRSLMAEIPGTDLHGAGLPLLARMVRLLVDLQRDGLDRTEELLSLGLPDWRAPALTRAIADVVTRTATELSPDDRETLAAFVERLPRRLEQIASCGLPDTLVHGDFYPGNFRGTEHALVLLDWGDCGVGAPLLDQSAFLDRVGADAVDPVRRLWNDAWRAAVPASDPERAARLLAPVAAARQAVVYRGFLDRIEPSEHPYHRGDPAVWLARAAALARGRG